MTIPPGGRLSTLKPKRRKAWVTATADEWSAFKVLCAREGVNMTKAITDYVTVSARSGRLGATSPKVLAPARTR